MLSKIKASSYLWLPSITKETAEKNLERTLVSYFYFYLLSDLLFTVLMFRIAYQQS